MTPITVRPITAADALNANRHSVYTGQRAVQQAKVGRQRAIHKPSVMSWMTRLTTVNDWWNWAADQRELFHSNCMRQGCKAHRTVVKYEHADNNRVSNHTAVAFESRAFFSSSFFLLFFSNITYSDSTSCTFHAGKSVIFHACKTIKK